jgi:Flp pilus assembly protein TadB
MAQTKRKRKRKHRGTQGGSLDRRSRSRPRNRDEARAQARRSAGQRRDRPPTWQSAITRALLMSALLFALIVFIGGQAVGAALALSVTMLLIYIPAGYYLERFLYNRRRAAEQKRRAQQRG